MKITTRLNISAMLSAAMVLSVSLVFAVALMIQNDARERAKAAGELLNGAYELELFSDSYQRYPSERPREQWLLKYNSLVKSLEKTSSSKNGQRVFITRMRENLNHLKTLFDNLVETDTTSRPVSPEYRDRLADLFLVYSREISHDAVRLEYVNNAVIEDINREMVVVLPIIVIVMIGITLRLSMRIGKSIREPILKLHAGTETIGSGNLDYRIGIASNDEIGYLSAAFDQMTERLQATTVSRDELRREVDEREKLRRKNELILEAAGEGIFGVDSQGNYTFINEAAAATLGYEVDELIGRHCHSTNHYSRPDGTAYPEEECPVYAALRDGTSHAGEDVYLRKDGTSLPIEFTGKPLFEEDEIVGAVVTFRDITERKRAEEDLRKAMENLSRSNKELEQFAYIASHDLQEPLRKIASFSELLAKRYKGRIDDKADTYIAYIVDGANRMKILINDLLAYSRVMTGGKKLGEIDSNVVLRRVLEYLDMTIKENGAEITSDPLPVVIADEVQLGQVFQNLIVNAIKYRSDQPPNVHISAVKTEKEWIFSVRDNGIGIAPEFYERIFIIFQRLHTRTQYSGTGIGLAICKKIIDRHGGRIWVESEEGKGATFYFTIPLKGGSN